MKVTTGHLLLAVSFAVLGALSLGSGDFALNWQPVPAWVPGRHALAYLSGAMLLLSGFGLLWKKTFSWAAALLAANMLVWLLVLRIPRLFPGHLLDESMWLAVGETTMLVCGTGLLLGLPARPLQMIYGVALPLVGLSHFVYAQGSVPLVGWMPDPLYWIYLTGALHIAAGVAILTGRYRPLAARLEAVMISLFTLLVWIPRIVAAPGQRFPWTAFWISAALSGAAWMVSQSLLTARQPALAHSTAR